MTTLDEAEPNMALQVMLSRFRAVRPAGPNRWRCRRHGSGSYNVSVALSDSGKVLICDHAGRTSAEVLAELGMTLADLAPKRVGLDRVQSPQELRANAERLALASMQDIAKVLDTAATTVQAAAAILDTGHPLTSDDRAQLAGAHEAITAARMMLKVEIRP